LLFEICDLEFFVSLWIRILYLPKGKPWLFHPRVAQINGQDATVKPEHGVFLFGNYGRSIERIVLLEFLIYVSIVFTGLFEGRALNLG